jgi:hypothetical protein
MATFVNIDNIQYSIHLPPWHKYISTRYSSAFFHPINTCDIEYAIDHIPGAPQLAGE